MGTTPFSTLYLYARRRMLGKSDTTAVAIQKEAVNRALKMIAERDHPYFLSRGFINIKAPQESSVVGVTQNADTATLVSGTFPSAAVGRMLEIGAKYVHFQVGTLNTARTIASFAAGAQWVYASDAAASYRLYQDAYALPTDFRKIGYVWDETVLADVAWLASFAEFDYAKQHAITLTGSPRWACIADGKLHLWPCPDEPQIAPFVYYRWPATLTADADTMDFDDNQIELVYTAIDYMIAKERGKDEDKKLQAFLWHEKRMMRAAGNPESSLIGLGGSGPNLRIVTCKVHTD